jgi:hypothetical protein
MDIRAGVLNRRRLWLPLIVIPALATSIVVSAQTSNGIEYRVLATTRTSTMEKALNEAAEAGFRFQAAMGGETSNGGNEVAMVMSRSSESNGRFAYKLLATSRTSTMERGLQDAADAGFEFRAQTVFKSVFGGDEVICILERDKDAPARKSQYKLLATSKTSTLQKELEDVGAIGYQVIGMTVAKTAIGGKEVVAILRRARP